MDPSCKEVRDAMEDLKLLDHHNKTLDLETFHKEIVAALPIVSMMKGGKKKHTQRVSSQKGGMNLRRCILLGLFVILLTAGSYIISVRSEMSIYQAKCANVMHLFDAKRGSVSTFFNEFNKFAQMVFNKEHIDYCKNMEDKYGSLGIYMARELNKTMGTLKARMTASFAIVTAIVSILNGGVHALVCIAAKWLGELDTICGDSCSNGNSKERKTQPPKTSKKLAKKEEEEHEDEEEESEDEE